MIWEFEQMVIETFASQLERLFFCVFSFNLLFQNVEPNYLVLLILKYVV